MRRPLAILSLLCAPLTAMAGWQTVYNSNFSLAYIQSVNGSLYKLPVANKDASESDINMQMRPIASAPANSSLVVDRDGHLLAVWGAGECATAPLEISQYNPSTDQWSSLAQSDMKGQLWHQAGQIVWLDRSEDNIYVYGGHCNGKTQTGFYRFDLATNQFSKVSVGDGVMPRAMSEAQTLALDDYQTLVLGGRAGDAWMSMQQIAIWGYGSWTFNSVANSSGIDSRENPLLLPVFTYGQNGTSARVSEIVVVGGTVAGRPAQPEICVLRNSGNAGWYWDMNAVQKTAVAQLDVKRSADTSEPESLPNLTYAGSTLYSTLASIDASTRKVSLYGPNGTSNWEPVKFVSVDKTAYNRAHNQTKSTSPAVIAVVSTLLPVIFLCLLAGGFWWWWRRRRERRLFLLPNRINMLRRQPSANSSTNSNYNWNNGSSWSNWTPASIPSPDRASSSLPRLPRSGSGDHDESDDASVHMIGSENGNQLYMSRQRRSLHVVNPDGAPSEESTPIIGSHDGPVKAAGVDEKAAYMSRPQMNDGAHPAEAQHIMSEVEGRTKNQAVKSRDSSWSSTNSGPFSDKAEHRTEFDFGV